jgi:hypothetical protein
MEGDTGQDTGMGTRSRIPVRPHKEQLMKGRPIRAAYTDTGALDITCGRCRAGPGQWCTAGDGRVRRVPCVERAAAGVGSGDGKHYARDFSEPAHERGAR